MNVSNTISDAGNILLEISSARQQEGELDRRIDNDNIETATTNHGNVSTEIEIFSEPFKRNLSIDWLIKKYNCLTLSRKIASGRSRQFIHCNICKEFEAVARKYSKSHFLPIVDGIRVDDQEKLWIEADYLNSESYQQATLAKERHKLWKSRSEQHDWRKYLSSQDDRLIQDLTRCSQ